jgi:phosphate-selective porin OprO/OprP
MDLSHTLRKDLFVLLKAHRSLLASTLTLSLSLLGAGAHAQDAPPPPPPAAETPAAPESPPPPPSAVEQRVDEIDQRTRILDRKLELLEEASAARKAADPVLSAADKGFGWKSADGAFGLKLGAVLQLDGREFLHDKALSGKADTFVVRKARPILQATFFDVADLRLMPEFGNGSVGLWDAYVDLRPFSWLGVRGGKFKTPLALERAQSEAAVVFPERAFPTILAPNRDVGLELFSSLLGGVISLEAGIFNGNSDNSIEDIDANHAKDFAGRIFLLPFKTDPHSLLANLGVGFGASTGNLKGTTASTGLPPYRTPGQQPFFSYLTGTAADATVLTKGRRTRWSPQAYYYAGPFGVLAEYIQSQQHLVKGTNAVVLEHKAWQVAGELVFGGKPLFEGVQVNAPFDAKKGHWGAFELAVRYHALDFDDATFPLFADPTASPTAAKAWGFALNWHWSRNIKLSLALERTKFKGGAKGGGTPAAVVDRKTEYVLFERIQGAF